MSVQETIQQDKYQATILGIRAANFKKGIPFLILSNDLPDGMCYCEFNDGRIELQEVFKEGAAIKTKVIRILSETEATKVRVENGLF